MRSVVTGISLRQDRHGGRQQWITKMQRNPISKINCACCGHAIKPKRRGRSPKYCSARCRDDGRRSRNYASFGLARYPSSRVPRNATNHSIETMPYKGCLTDRGAVNSGLWREIVATEVINPHRWRQIVSADGVVSYQTTLRQPALISDQRLKAA